LSARLLDGDRLLLDSANDRLARLTPPFFTGMQVLRKLPPGSRVGRAHQAAPARVHHAAGANQPRDHDPVGVTHMIGSNSHQNDPAKMTRFELITH
jgi:hypothetical protein